MTFRRLIAAATVAACVLPFAGAASVQAGGGKTYKPPYKNGPAGGDEFNYVHRDRQSGQMGVFRLFPGFPPVVGCAPEPSAGWGMFRVEHRVTEPVKAVTATFDGALGAYVWATVGARGANGKWLGVEKYQGPHAGEKTITAKLFSPARHGRITIEFGLQLGDACPQAEAGAVEFTSVKVNR
jgi:hypothetical protein